MDHYNQNIKMRAIKYIFKVILKCKKLLKVKKIEPKILLNQSKFQFSTYTNFNMEQKTGQKKCLIKNLENYINLQGHNLLGYPTVPFVSENHAQIIKKFSNLQLINIGDSFQSQGNFKQNAAQFERKTIEFFGQVFKMNDYWGYIGSGSSEGNLQGLFCGREVLKKKYGQTPKFFTSTASHYSLIKYSKLLDLDTSFLPVNSYDEIDIENMRKEISNLDQSTPILLNINIGTTMKGGIDSLKAIVRMFKQQGRFNFYIHADMALYGMIYRYHHDFDEQFGQYVQSFTISGHKLFGIPQPCAVFVGKNRNVSLAYCQDQIHYIKNRDVTISGCRSGLSSLLFYQSIKNGEEQIMDRIQKCFLMTTYLEQQLSLLGVELLSKPKGITVCFPTPSNELCKKYQLATKKDFAHIIVMPHVSKELIDRFILDLQKQLP